MVVPPDCQSLQVAASEWTELCEVRDRRGAQTLNQGVLFTNYLVMWKMRGFVGRIDMLRIRIMHVEILIWVKIPGPNAMQCNAMQYKAIQSNAILDRLSSGADTHWVQW